MKIHANPLLEFRPQPATNVEDLSCLTIHRRDVRLAKRDVRDLRRKQTAAEAIAGLDHECSIYGFTKGQFSIIDLITAVLAHTGPAELAISTWTAANSDVTTVLDFCESGLVTAARWLVDLTFQRRSPELAQRIRNVFGPDAIRVAKNHAKFALIGNDRWSVIVRTSMNLNFNPRFENFELGHDPQLYDFHRVILDELWTNQPRSLAHERPYAIGQFFERCM